jgi:hypothetical protein
VPEDWSLLLVPALRASVVQRLRDITRADLAGLATVEQYRVEGDVLVHTAARNTGGSGEGLRWVGRELQLGLTAREIAGVSSKRDSVLAIVAHGRLSLDQR